MKDMFSNKSSLLLSGLLLLVGAYFFQSQPVEALSGSDFKAGNIISNADFTNKNSMSETQIQSWLEQMGSTCLRNYTTAEPLGNNKYGKQVKASRAIWKVSQLFDINPQVILVTLQKEQGFITRSDCPTWRYNTAMGFGCPDGQPCDDQWYGLSRQLYQGARHFRGFYNNSPGWWIPFTTGNNYIGYHPSGSSCGGSTVNIQNRATVALYSYTPYQPNKAALNNLYGAASGSGSECAAYGNRNFWRDFNIWFGGQLNYESLLSPRAMVLREDAQKTDLQTGQLTGSILEEGRVIRKFETKINIDGVIYLRSQHDTGRNNHLGFPINILGEVILDYEPLEQELIMELTNSTHKTNLSTAESVGSKLEKGRVITFAEKLEYNNETYYRTAVDKDRGRDFAIPASLLTTEISLAYEPLLRPRAMTLNEDTPKINLRTRQESGTPLEAGRVIRQFETKIHLNGITYLRSQHDTENNSDLGFPMNKLDEVSLEYEPLSEPTVLQLTHDTQKTDLPSAQSVGTVLSENRLITFTQKLSYSNQVYYRTEVDTNRGVHLAIPSSSLTDSIVLEYEDMLIPREMRIRETTTKTDLITRLNQDDGRILESGREIMFTTKVSVNGITYLRTEHDTGRGRDLGIPLSNLENIE